MFANRYTALIDACTLVSVWRRNLLLTLAEAEFFRLRWSEKILSETEGAISHMLKERGLPDYAVRAKRSVDGMQAAFPEAWSKTSPSSKLRHTVYRTRMTSMF